MIGLREVLMAAIVSVALAACQPSAPTAETATVPTAIASAPPPQTLPAAPAQASTEIDADFVLPGDFAPHTTRADLEGRFGKKNVRIDQVPGGEGETYRGIILFPNDPQRRAYLYFVDEKTLAGLNTVRIMDAGSRWSLANGLRMGMLLKDVVAMNGKPIKFHGLDWDYGGTVTSLEGGKLARSTTAGALLNFSLRSRDDLAPQDENAYPIGEPEFSSDDSEYPRQGEIIEIGEISLSFPDKRS